jgi:hypothetical protein
MTKDHTITLELEVEQVNQILEALGALPFARVYQLISSIQQQAQAQLGEPASEPAKESER